MKKLTVVMIAILTVGLGKTVAQTEQGNVLLGLSTNFSSVGSNSEFMNTSISSISYKSDADGYAEPEPDKTTSINMTPKIGFLIAENFAAGIDLSLSYSSSKDGEIDFTSSQTLFGVGPFLRYYIPAGAVLPYFEVNSSFGTIKSKYKWNTDTFTDEEESKTALTSIGGGVGVAVPLGEHATFDFLAGFNSFTYKEKDDNEDNERIVIGTLALKAGFSFYLGN